MKPCYIFDLDGTLADPSHRLRYIKGEKKDWKKFFESVGDDELIIPVAELLDDLAANTEIVIVTGRSDECRKATADWLSKHEIDYVSLHMRKAGDRRPDYIVKLEILVQLRSQNYLPIMAFEDRASVASMWRENGVLCALLAEVDF